MLRVLLDENNDLPPGGPVFVDGIESVRVALQAILGTQAGEWPFDFTFGTPWRGEILRKFFDAGTTRAIIAERVNTLVPEIEPVTSAQIEIDTETFAAERQVVITVRGVTVGNETADLSTNVGLAV